MQLSSHKFTLKGLKQRFKTFLYVVDMFIDFLNFFEYDDLIC